jgi:hypothetical protein
MSKSQWSSGKKKTSHSLTQLAFDKLERLGLEPLQELYEAMTFAKNKTLEGGNFDKKNSTDQANFLALWIKSAETIAKFRYPMLAAVAVQVSGQEDRKSLSTMEAIEVIKNDPFSTKEVKEIPTGKILDAMQETGKMLPKLPSGERID